jgi:hypothetical protein
MQDYLNSTRRSVTWLKQAHDRDQLVMRPPFQRRPVWTEAQQSFLIDTILRGYPIPELYMQEEVDAAGQERYVVVDGQQRIRACLLFLEGKFGLDPEKTPEWPDLQFDDLSDDEKKRIFAYNFIVRQIPIVDEAEIRAVFGRLNRNNVALNAQELRHSTYSGDFIATMEKLAEGEFWTTSGVFTTNDIRRMLDVEFISEMTIAVLHGPQNKKDQLERYYGAYEREFPDKARIEQTFAAVLGEIGALLPDIAKLRWRKKSDFYSLFAYLASHADRLPLASDKRTKAETALRAFAARVDKYMSVASDAPKHVAKYIKAVERAASDLANRRTRHDAIATQLKGIFKAT